MRSFYFFSLIVSFSSLVASFSSFPDSPKPLASSGSFLPPKRNRRTSRTTMISPVPILLNIVIYMIALFNSNASSNRNKGTTVRIEREMTSFGGEKRQEGQYPHKQSVCFWRLPVFLTTFSSINRVMTTGSSKRRPKQIPMMIVWEKKRLMSQILETLKSRAVWE